MMRLGENMKRWEELISDFQRNQEANIKDPKQCVANFTPIRPGLTIQLFLREENISVEELARRADIELEGLKELVYGDRAMIGADIAIALAKALGTTADFWLHVEFEYQSHLLKVCHKTPFSFDFFYDDVVHRTAEYGMNQVFQRPDRFLYWLMSWSLGIVGEWREFQESRSLVELGDFLWELAATDRLLSSVPQYDEVSHLENRLYTDGGIGAIPDLLKKILRDNRPISVADEKFRQLISVVKQIKVFVHTAFDSYDLFKASQIVDAKLRDRYPGGYT